MNELDEAKALLNSRSFKLKDISKETKIPYDTIRSYCSHPETMERAAWIRIHTLAKLYEKWSKNLI